MDTAVGKAGRLSWVWVCRVMVFVREGTNKPSLFVFFCQHLVLVGIQTENSSARTVLLGSCFEIPAKQ